jgi:hypothetical protein
MKTIQITEAIPAGIIPGAQYTANERALRDFTRATAAQIEQRHEAHFGYAYLSARQSLHSETLSRNQAS